MEPSFHASIGIELKLKMESVVINLKGMCLYSCVGPGRQTAQYEFGILPNCANKHSGAERRPTEYCVWNNMDVTR